MTTLAGANALSPFRAQQLLPALQAIHPKAEDIAARFVHLVVTDAAPAIAEQERLAAQKVAPVSRGGGSIDLF